MINYSDIGILIVDDDDEVRNTLLQYLADEGFRAITVSSGSELRRKLNSEKMDLVLIDVGLHGEDRLELARELRATSDVGIIMLSEHADIIDRVVGIEIGADDYITKPFHMREVLARIKAVVRRVRGCRHEERTGRAESADGVILAFAEWRFFLDQRRLINSDGEDTVLTTGEFDLLAALVRNAGRVLSRDQLLDITRGQSWVALDRTIDAQVARLRKKIEPDPKHPSLIKSVRGVGYIFAAKVQHLDA